MSSYLLLVLVLIAAVHAQSTNLDGLFCGEPPEGTWEVKHYTAEIDSATGGRTLLGRGLYNLTRVFPGGYSGT